MAFRGFLRLGARSQNTFLRGFMLDGQGKSVVNPVWKQCAAAYCTPTQDVRCEYRHGLPVLLVPLPSRKEHCQFTLKPVTETVGDFLSHLKKEDGGIETVSIYSEDNVKIARSTSIDVLMRNPFTLKINDDDYRVDPPELEKLISEDARTMADVKSMVYQLYSTLHVEQHQLEKERDLRKQLENLQEELEPLEKLRKELNMRAQKKSNYVVWGGLAYMGLQFGFLARLTWWEYSWDIVEPITYFVTYGAGIFFYMYFVLTRQEFLYPDAQDRVYLTNFHKFAKKKKLDVEKYNEIRDRMNQIEKDIQRLRDPLALHLPIAPPPPSLTANEN
ncbi:calcium uniporter protein, mitochondrial-like [Amphiura filiformis]|uniref:calcium uniporter protein, mitochondrial-like n=1 Tax=Amphiura filiformis TaxID=82378 RepID=UPI003B21309A